MSLYRVSMTLNYKGNLNTRRPTGFTYADNEHQALKQVLSEYIDPLFQTYDHYSDVEIEKLNY